MQVSDKSFVRKFVEMLPNVETKSKEHETLDNLIRQTIVSDSLLSFTKVGESPVQWIHWLDTIDQQNTNKGLKSSKLEAVLDVKDRRLEEALVSEHTKEVPVVKDSLHSSIKGSNMFGRGLQTSGDRLHSLKFPEAMVAFAQAAAKANDLPGWPLMSNKVQVQKCEKCSQEFYSTLNQRRHMRATHRRPLNVDKEDLKKKKEQVAAYWDKLNCEEACEIVSFKNISLPDLSAASVVRALSAHSQQGLLSLPQSYVKVAMSLLDIVQNKPSRFPISSEELLNILEDASEKNLLYGVTSSSMQRCIFDNEPGRVGLETKNLVASLGFLVELRLVKAWMEDKDVEALRCQKVLVEEEEAAQKKREKLQERKRQKKMRQKESKDKERKESENSCGLQRLKLDLFSGGNCTGNGEGEDSPTATQSSPSSSGYSGQDPNHLETPLLDLNEFGGGDDGKADSENEMLADEPPAFIGDLSDLHHGRGQGSPTFFLSGTSEEQAGVTESSGGANTFHVDSLISDRDSNLQSSSHGGVQDAMEQNGPPDHRGQFRTINGKFVSERKIGGQGWRERRQYDMNDFSTYQKHLYSYDRRYYDYPYGSQRGLRKPYAAGNSASEFSNIPMVPKVNATPQYGQYREKYSGTKRPNVGSGHAVWTRKAPQNCVSESDQPHEQPNSAVSTNCTGEALSDTCLVSAEKSEVFNSGSVDSVTPHSPSIVPANIGTEKQVTVEELSASYAISAPALSDPIAGMDLASCDGGGELSIASGAVFVGSLEIPLGNGWSNLLEHRSSSGNSHEALNCLSEEVKDIPGKKLEVSESSTRAGTIELDVICSSGAANPLQEVRTSLPEVLRESSSNVKDTTYHQNVPGDPSHRHVEKVLKVFNGVNKLGMTKVWRPVVVGEHNDSLIAGSVSGREEVGERRIDVTGNSNVHTNREAQGAGVLDLASFNSHDNAIENIQENDNQEALSLEGSCSSSFKSDAFETDASREDLFDHQCTARYMVGSSGGEVYEMPPMFPYIANFLSQRWADAITCAESIEMTIHLRESNDFFVKSMTRSLSPSSDDGISSHQLQNEKGSMHKVGVHCES